MRLSRRAFGGEALTAGHEQVYLQSFFWRLAFAAAAIGDADLDHYTGQNGAASAMRAGFALTRAFDCDAEAYRAALAARGS